MRANLKLVIDNNDPAFVRVYDAGHSKPLLLNVIHEDQWGEMFGYGAWDVLVKRQPCTVTITLEWDS